MLLHIFNDEFESNTEATISNINNITGKEPVRQKVLFAPPPFLKKNNNNRNLSTDFFRCPLLCHP